MGAASLELTAWGMSPPPERAEDARCKAAATPSSSEGSPATVAVPAYRIGVHAPLADLVPVTPTTPLRSSTDAPLLPPATDPQRMTLVLDLDGTLIASEDEPHAPVPFDYCVDDERFVWLRPGLRRFLDAVRPQFEVVLFTAAGESWATCAMQRIDPDGTLFDSRLYRDHTVFHDDWPWVKDLSRLGRDLARVVIVDDNPLMFMYQPDNALHVAAYDPQIAGYQDDVLEQVLDVLVHKLLPAGDVREVLRGLKDPITASCVAARKAAAKVAAGPDLNAKGSGAMHASARKAPGSALGALTAGTYFPVVDAGGGSGGSSMSPADRALSGPPLLAPVSGGQGKAGRRGRRSPRTQSQQAQQQQQQHAGQPNTHQAAVVALPVPRSQQQHAGGLPSHGPLQQPHGERKQRQQRRRRGSGGSGGAEKSCDAASAFEAGQVQPTVLRASVVSRQPVIVSRSWGRKQVSTHVALQQAAATALQQPEHQLHLKLKLLQLQREQEEEEPESGVEDEEQPSAGLMLAIEATEHAAACSQHGLAGREDCQTDGHALSCQAQETRPKPTGALLDTAASCSGAAATRSHGYIVASKGGIIAAPAAAAVISADPVPSAGVSQPAASKAADGTRRGSRSSRRRRRRRSADAGGGVTSNSGRAAGDMTGGLDPIPSSQSL